MSRQIIAMLAAILATTAVRAGGWSVATLEEWPVAPVVGEPATIRVAIRAHGRTPAGGLEVVAVARHELSGTETTVPGRQVATGVYELTLVFPESGTWQWLVDGYGEHRMPPLVVAENRKTAEPILASAGDLLVAKGCATCHDGRLGITAINGSRVPRLTGPDDYRGNPDFLRMWLANPQAVSSIAQMPKLELSEDEIEVLVAWLSK